MTQSEFITKMQDIYGDVYDRLHTAGYGELPRFFPVEGKKYREGKNRLMLVGRCTRRWWEFDFKNDAKKDYMAKAGECLSNGLGFDFWIDKEEKSKWAELRDTTTKPATFIKYVKEGEIESVKKQLKKNEELYIAHLSVPFFAYAQLVTKDLVPGAEEIKRSCEHIVWSNLYPVQEGNINTSKELRNLLFEPSVELLRTQIEYYNPTHILFMTDWIASMNSWFEAFANKENFKAGRKMLFENIKQLNAHPNTRFPIIVATGKAILEHSANTPLVVVTSRPDRPNNKGRTYEVFAQEVLDAFAGLK